MIQTEFGVFDGDKWEGVCKICFYRMYEEQNEIYTHIEASPGDDGLEGFTRTGKAFQCYCPDRNYSAEELYQKQIAKINKDLRKLKDKEEAIKKHLGNVKIKTWFLVTPEIRKKEIVAYCNKKTEEVKEWNLSIVDNSNFNVTAVDIAFVLPYLKIALNSIDQKIQYNPTERVSEGNVIQYKGDESYLVGNVINKHRKKLNQQNVGTDANIDKLTHKTIKHYLDGRKVLEMWQNESPKEYEKFRRIIGQEEEDIEELCLFPNENHNQRYKEVKERTIEKLSTAFQHIDEITIRDLANYVIADWLLRCPLNFV